MLMAMLHPEQRALLLQGAVMRSAVWGGFASEQAELLFGWNIGGEKGGLKRHCRGAFFLPLPQVAVSAAVGVRTALVLCVGQRRVVWCSFRHHLGPASFHKKDVGVSFLVQAHLCPLQPRRLQCLEPSSFSLWRWLGRCGRRNGERNAHIVCALLAGSHVE